MIAETSEAGLLNLANSNGSKQLVAVDTKGKSRSLGVQLQA